MTFIPPATIYNGDIKTLQKMIAAYHMNDCTVEVPDWLYLALEAVRLQGYKEGKA
jgi:hypothetical protein